MLLCTDVLLAARNERLIKIKGRFSPTAQKRTLPDWLQRDATLPPPPKMLLLLPLFLQHVGCSIKGFFLDFVRKADHLEKPTQDTRRGRSAAAQKRPSRPVLHDQDHQTLLEIDRHKSASLCLADTKRDASAASHRTITSPILLL